MKALPLRIGACVLGLWVVGGCETPPGTPAPMGQWLPALDHMSRNAAVREQTLYDADFHRGQPEPNEAGQSRLRRIVRYGHLDVPYVFVARNWTSAELTEARVARVREYLEEINEGPRPWQVRSANVVDWPMSGEESVIAVDGMIEAFAKTRSPQGSSSGMAGMGSSDGGGN